MTSGTVKGHVIRVFDVKVQSRLRLSRDRYICQRLFKATDSDALDEWQIAGYMHRRRALRRPNFAHDRRMLRDVLM